MPDTSVPYRVLIIGCGSIAGRYDADRAEGALPLTHAGGFDANDRFELTACVDPDDSVRIAFAERWNVPHNAVTLDELGAEVGEFDVISICSPTQYHSVNVEQALALQPRLIFCEKPVAKTFDDARLLVNRCERSNVALAVNFTRRWAPDLVMLAHDIQAGHWGRPLAATSWYTKGITHNGSHMVDLLRMMLGDLKLIACGEPVLDFWADDPSVPALLEGKDGSSIHLVCGDARAFTQFELLMTFERGEIAMREGGFLIETRRVEDNDTFVGYRTLGKRDISAGRYEAAMACAIENIADHLDHGKALASTGVNALAAQALCEAIRQQSINRDKDTMLP